MSFTFALNYRPTSHGEFWWKFKETAKAAGWSIAGSGDTVSGAMDNQDRLDPSGSYNGSMDIVKSWFVMQEPSGGLGRQFLFVSTGTAYRWHSYYLSSGSFGGGNANTRPSSSYEQNIMTGSWHTAPTNTNKYFSDFIFGGADEKFSFFACAREFKNSLISGIFFMDVLEHTSSLDKDPAIVGASDNSDDQFILTTQFFKEDDPGSLEPRAYGWYKKDETDEAFVHYSMGKQNVETGFAGGDNFTDDLTCNETNGNLWHTNVYYSRGSSVSNPGFKGVSRLFRMTPYMATPRQYGDLSRVIFGTLSIPWDGNTQLIF